MLRIIDLPWLLKAPTDLRERLATIARAPGDEWDAPVRTLATHRLDARETALIAKTLAGLRTRGTPHSLATIKLGIVSNGTTDLIRPALEVAALRHGVLLEIVAAEFDQSMQQAMDPGSTINRARPDAVLVAIDHRGYPFGSATADSWPPYRATEAVERIAQICSAFQRNAGATCLVQNVASPRSLMFGSLDRTVKGTFRRSIQAFNDELALRLPESGDLLVDIDWLAQMVGLDEWFDERFWYMARLPLSQRAVPVYADFVARVLGAMRGKSHKCLVLDLDNTIWGGVVGDDGIENLSLSEGDARGEAFRAVQAAAAALRRRGVVLAVCSKNDEALARRAFREHPGMLLKESDIAAFVANWDDKATNLERIARQLELGLDAMVLLDDNPSERAQVRQALPMVAVPELGNDPSDYAQIVLTAGYFEAVAFTSEDLGRADLYRSNAQREELQTTSRSLTEFLQSLDMRIEFEPFDPVNRTRVTQLINKTNQFNVTTRRYVEKQVAGFESSSEHYTLRVAVRDRFGDNGTIALAICVRQGEVWKIDTWLMSCRVLNRRIEEAMCNRIVADARDAGVRTLWGEFIPTERNGVAANLFPRLGFVRGNDDASRQDWFLDVDVYAPFDVPITVVRREVSVAAAERLPVVTRR